MSTGRPKIEGLTLKMPPPQKVKLAGSLDFGTCRKKNYLHTGLWNVETVADRPLNAMEVE